MVWPGPGRRKQWSGTTPWLVTGAKLQKSKERSLASGLRVSLVMMRNPDLGSPSPQRRCCLGMGKEEA